MSANVIGIDLSLSCTGIASGHATTTVKPKKLAGLDRLRWITTEVKTAVHLLAFELAFGPPLVAVEGPSYNSKGGHEHERGGLWWYVIDALDQADVDVVVVPPAVLKKYATGKGNAGKDEVLLATSRRFSWFAGGNDEADALWLAAIAAELKGDPLLVMPIANRVDLAKKVTWIREAAP